MSFMFELYYRLPVDEKREVCIENEVAEFGGRLDFREENSASDTRRCVCLTFEFDDLARAQSAAKSLRSMGEHVEGPEPY